MAQIPHDNPLLSIRGLTISLDEKEVVRDVNLEIARGMKLGITGASGAGKSLTAWTILGLTPGPFKVNGNIVLVSDAVTFNMTDPEEARAARASCVSVVPQNPATSLNPSIRCGIQISKAEPEKVRAILGEMGIEDPDRIYNSYPHQLSGGQLQRVVLAMALIKDPDLLIADEPATALDSITKAELIDLLNNWTARTGAALLLVTHDMEVLRKTCTHVAHLEGGNLSGPETMDDSNNSSGLTKKLEQTGAKDVLLEIDGLTKAYHLPRGRVIKALDKVSLQMAEGEVVGVVGQSGSGKTTLAKCIVGLLTHDDGQILFNGRKLNYDKGKEDRRRVQMIFQDPYSALYPHRTVGYFIGEVLRLHFGLRGTTLDEQIVQLLDEVGLSSDYCDRMPGTLSGGERQRVQMARALAMQPDLIICDECVTGLDSDVQQRILGLIRDLAEKRGMAVLFISHDLNVIRAIADRIIVMDAGRIIEQGGTKELLDAPQEDLTRRLVRAIQ